MYIKKEEAVTIDGPAAAGKSTIAKIVSQKLNYIYIDTGAMYRALTLRALEDHINIDSEQALVNLLNDTDIHLTQHTSGQKVMMNGEDVTHAIRSENVTHNVSHIAKYPGIRKEMVKRQRKLARLTSVVMDGRDIGSHVLPMARHKFFLTASVEERAKRRYEENIKKGFKVGFADLKNDIAQRDLQDKQRDVAPLIKADDAIEIDTTSLTIEQVVERILDKISKATI